MVAVACYQIKSDATCLFGYKKGVISNCTGKSVDHATLLVGAGSQPPTPTATAAPVVKGANMPYWIVKNSWGPGFGEYRTVTWLRRHIPSGMQPSTVQLRTFLHLCLCYINCVRWRHNSMGSNWRRGRLLQNGKEQRAVRFSWRCVSNCRLDGFTSCKRVFARSNFKVIRSIFTFFFDS